MADLFSPYTLNGMVLRNRIVMAPMVNVGWASDDGVATGRHLAHYAARARNGVGLIIVEATGVSREGRAFPSQLGLWDQQHVIPLARIAQGCRAQGARVMIQLAHSGLRTPEAISKRALGPSAFPAWGPGTAEMSGEEVSEVRQAFISAAVRAAAAGFDGVELHGAHGTLLEQFLWAEINQRTDEYGGNLENRVRLVREIIAGIRQELGSRFTVGLRLGCTIPRLADGIAAAREMVLSGVDYLHVSWGGLKPAVTDPEKAEAGMSGILPEPPLGFLFSRTVYCAGEVKRQVPVPVIAVGDIRTPQTADRLIGQGLADLAAIGKDLLTDAAWGRKAASGEGIYYCLRCGSRCPRLSGSECCPLYQADEEGY